MCVGRLQKTAYQTIKGEIHTNVFTRWIQEMPNTQMSHTITVMMMTPAQAGSAPFESAARHEAPEMELTAFQPVVEMREKTTTSRFPQ